MALSANEPTSLNKDQETGVQVQDNEKEEDKDEDEERGPSDVKLFQGCTACTWYSPDPAMTLNLFT